MLVLLYSMHLIFLNCFFFILNVRNSFIYPYISKVKNKNEMNIILVAFGKVICYTFITYKYQSLLCNNIFLRVYLLPRKMFCLSLIDKVSDSYWFSSSEQLILPKKNIYLIKEINFTRTTNIEAQLLLWLYILNICQYGFETD